MRPRIFLGVAGGVFAGVVGGIFVGVEGGVLAETRRGVREGLLSTGLEKAWQVGKLRFSIGKQSKWYHDFMISDIDSKMTSWSCWKTLRPFQRLKIRVIEKTFRKSSPGLRKRTNDLRKQNLKLNRFGHSERLPNINPPLMSWSQHGNISNYFNECSAPTSNSNSKSRFFSLTPSIDSRKKHHYPNHGSLDPLVT